MKKVLLLLVFLGLLLRFWDYGEVPPSLNRDEAALGYNAFALASEGVDEYGRSWPLMFESFGDYKLPGYIYALVPFVSLMGLADWVIRLPSLIAGLALLWLSFQLTKQLLDTRWAWWMVAVTAVSPWAIFYSRMAWEAHLGLMWLGLCLWLMGKKITWLTGSLVMLTYLIAVLTYNTPLLLAPFIVVFIWLGKQPIKKKFLLSAIIASVAVIVALLLAPLTAQKQAITIFTDPTIRAMQQERYVVANTPLERLRDNRFTNWGSIMIDHFFSSFSPRFLIFDGGAHPWHSIPGRGHLFLTTYLLGLVGIGWKLTKLVKGAVDWSHLRWWLLFSGGLMPAIVTVDAPHATRSLLFLWLWGLAAVVGIKFLNKLTAYAVIVVIVGLLVETAVFVQGYYGYFPDNMPSSWPQGVEQSVHAAMNTSDAGLIGISNIATNPNYSLLADQPYIYALLYSETKPSTFVSSVTYNPRDAAGLVRVAGFEGFVFANDPTDIPDGSVMIERNTRGVYAIKD